MKRKKAKKNEFKEKDVIFYLDIWNTRQHFCIVSGNYLGREPLTVFFHHLLPKSKFPQYRHCSWNIVLVTWEVHDQIEKNIDKVPSIKKMTDRLLIQHHNGELENCTI